MAPCREALSSHFRSRPAGEFAERVAVGAEDGQDALLGEETYLYWLSIYYKLINEIYTNKLHYLRRAGAMERIVGQTKLYFMET